MTKLMTRVGPVDCIDCCGDRVFGGFPCRNCKGTGQELCVYCQDEPGTIQFHDGLACPKCVAASLADDGGDEWQP